MELIQELRDRKFQELDTQLSSYQKAFERNVLEEGNLAIAFDTFSSTDATFAPILEEWVQKEPTSYPAHLARAQHLLALGWQARGDRFANKTSEQQFSEMKSLLVEGAKEAIAAIKLNPKSSIAYGLIVDATKGLGDGDEMEKAYLAHEAQRDGDLKRAIRLYNQALEEGGDYSAVYLYRGNTYAQIQRHDEALEDLNRANRLRPQNPKALASLAYVYYGLTRPKDALAVIQEYQQFAQPDPYLLNIELWAQNFGAGSAPAVKTGGN